MELPFHLQKLPPEALQALRYLYHHGAQTALELEGSGLSARTVGKAIRRLINADYIEKIDEKYALTTDGKIATQQILEWDAVQAGQPVTGDNGVPRIKRRLVVVAPRNFVAQKPVDLYIGINSPPAGDVRLPTDTRLELRVTALGGTLPVHQIALDVPPDKAAAPARLRLLPDALTGYVRVRVDAFQTLELDAVEPLGGMFFDVPVYVDVNKYDRTPRAVGIDVTLRG